MAITYEIDVERRTILVRATGELTEHKLFDCHHRLARDPAVRPELSILFDLRGARGESIATEGVRGPGRPPPGPVAGLAARGRGGY